MCEGELVIAQFHQVQDGCSLIDYQRLLLNHGVARLVCACDLHGVGTIIQARQVALDLLTAGGQPDVCLLQKIAVFYNGHCAEQSAAGVTGFVRLFVVLYVCF